MAAAPETPAASANAEGEKRSADERQLELAEHNAKLAEKLESTAATVAGIAERVAQPHQPAPAAPQPPIRVTEEQVAAAIERQEITQAQGMQILSRQIREDARAEARQATQFALAEVGARATEGQVSNLIGQYKEHVPGLGRRGSPEWNETAARFHALVREGYPSTIATELQALRELYGRDPSKAGGGESAAVRERTKERATRGAETSSPSSSRTGTPRARRASEPDADLSAEHRSYVERMIQIGQYKGWDDPRAQKYAERAKATASRRRSA